MKLGRQGQAQILIVLGASVFLLATMLFMLDYSRQMSTIRHREARIDRLYLALSKGTQLAHSFYLQSMCIPWRTHRMLDLVAENGSISSTTVGRRRVRFDIDGQLQYVHFGAVTPPSGGAFVLPTYPSFVDAAVEVFATDGDLNVRQTVALINTCNYPCAYPSDITDPTSDTANCADNTVTNMGNSRSFGSYHRLTYAGAPGTAPPTKVFLPNGERATCTAAGGQVTTYANYVAGVGIGPTATANTLNVSSLNVSVADLRMIRDFLRTGSPPMVPVGAGFQGPNLGCADINLDYQVTEEDLGLYEKIMKGYLLAIPPIWPRNAL